MNAVYGWARQKVKVNSIMGEYPINRIYFNGQVKKLGTKNVKK